MVPLSGRSPSTTNWTAAIACSRVEALNRREG
jgi:hypothetical protein